MRKWLHRIRGAIGMGVVWGVAWSFAGFALAAAMSFAADAPFPLIFGVLGFAAGIIFSALLALTEGRRRLDQLSLPRFAAWGAAGGLLLSAVFVKAASLGLADAIAIVPAFAIASALCASGSLAVARDAIRPELPDRREDVTDVGLTDQEKRDLLGSGE